MTEKENINGAQTFAEEGDFTSSSPSPVVEPNNVFGNEEGHAIKCESLSWQLVAVLMIAEIVGNGMLSLPQTGGAVGVKSLRFFAEYLSFSRLLEIT